MARGGSRHIAMGNNFSLCCVGAQGQDVGASELRVQDAVSDGEVSLPFQSVSEIGRSAQVANPLQALVGRAEEFAGHALQAAFDFAWDRYVGDEGREEYQKATERYEKEMEAYEKQEEERWRKRACAKVEAYLASQRAFLEKSTPAPAESPDAGNSVCRASLEKVASDSTSASGSARSASGSTSGAQDTDEKHSLHTVDDEEFVLAPL